MIQAFSEKYKMFLLRKNKIKMKIQIKMINKIKSSMNKMIKHNNFKFNNKIRKM